MPLDSISQKRLSEINPSLAILITRMAEFLEQQHIVIRVTQGLRTWAEQDALYAQGRTLPGAIVTRAKGGESWHNLGCAVDLVPLDPAPDWNVDHADWKRMLEIGTSLGLTEGAGWCHPDNPHVQFTGRFPMNAPNDEARQIYQNEGAAAFWAEVNRA